MYQGTTDHCCLKGIKVLQLDVARDAVMQLTRMHATEVFWPAMLCVAHAHADETVSRVELAAMFKCDVKAVIWDTDKQPQTGANLRVSSAYGMRCIALATGYAVDKSSHMVHLHEEGEEGITRLTTAFRADTAAPCCSNRCALST